MFNTGDIVQLNSGGPLMTVADCNELVFVMWFNDNKDIQEADLHPNILRLVESKEQEEYDE